MMVEPEPPPTTTLRFVADDPCTSEVPQPNDLFIDADGRSEREACTPPADPIDAAVFSALLNEGAAIDSVITLPVDGTLDRFSLTSTVMFSFTSTSTPNVPQEGVPPLVVLKQIGTASRADGWEIVNPAATFSAGQINLQPPGDLDRGRRYVVIATSGLRDLESPPGRLVQSEAVAAIVSTQPITTDTIEDLTPETAARLERQRMALQDVLGVVTSSAANPPLQRSDIVSIHSFTTQRGFERIIDEVARYYDAIDRDRYGFEVTLSEVQLPSIYIGVPAAAYQNVERFFQGVIKAPKFLEDDGRWRQNWAEVVETIDIHFTISVPQAITGGPVVVHVPGYGRGSFDGRSLADKMAEGADTYVMTIDMRCHGYRSIDEGGTCIENRTMDQIDDLRDANANNGNPDILGRDGIPDDSGIGFFPGDITALRDSQMAAVLELVHVLSSLRDPSNYQPQVSPNVSRTHMIAQGYMAPLALIATTLVEGLPTSNMTVQLPSGGAGLAEIIANAPADQRNAFVNDLPSGLDENDLPTLLQRLEVMFEPLDLQNYREALREQFENGPDFDRVLLSHSSTEEFITVQARQTLIDAIGLASDRISEHQPTCDDFYLYTCQAGQDAIQQQTAVDQLVRFVDSRGVTVLPPAR